MSEDHKSQGSTGETSALSSTISGPAATVDPPTLPRTASIKTQPDFSPPMQPATSMETQPNFSPPLPAPRSMQTPPGFPPDLVGRTLQAAEFLHVFAPGLIGRRRQPTGLTVQYLLATAPTASTFLAALVGTDLESFDYICRHLIKLVRCYWSIKAEDIELGIQLPLQTIKKEYVMELVRRMLSDHFRLHRGQNRLTEMDIVVERLKTVEYSELTIRQKLALIEEMSSMLLRLPAVLRWLPIVHLEPLASLTDGSRLWWLHCAPDRLMVEPPASVPEAGAWRYYTSPEELEALRRLKTTESGLTQLNAAIERVLQHLQQEPAAPATELMEPNPYGTGRAAIQEYLRAWFISRLVGAAELLHRELPPGSCMSPHRLRHYLAGSVRPSEMADCLLQFEKHLAPSMRIRYDLAKLWRENVHTSGTLSALNWYLDEMLMAINQLTDKSANRQGVCGCCRGAIEGDLRDSLVFCHACCVNYHRQCAEVVEPATAAAKNSLAVDARLDGTPCSIWLCADCRRPKQPPAKKRRLNAGNSRKQQSPTQQLSSSSSIFPTVVEIETARSMDVEQHDKVQTDSQQCPDATQRPVAARNSADAQSNENDSDTDDDTDVIDDVEIIESELSNVHELNEINGCSK